MKSKKPIEMYQTPDFQLAITLYTLGFKLLSIDKTSKRAVFQFREDAEISEKAAAFYKDELTLNPRIVLANARLLKDRLYAAY